jgi:TRAP-type C4-dicarboxylate transport system permease small subunit
MKKIASVLVSLEKVLARINAPVAVACGVVLFLFMFMVVSDVTGRYLFLTPVFGTTEIGQNVLAFVIFMSWAAVQASGQHIRVVILLDRFPPRWRVWLELLALAVGFAMIFSIAWYGLSFTIESYKTKEIFLTYGIPRYPGKAALFVGCTLFAIQFFIQFLSRLFTRLAGKIPAGKEQS